VAIGAGFAKFAVAVSGEEDAGSGMPCSAGRVLTLRTGTGVLGVEVFAIFTILAVSLLKELTGHLQWLAVFSCQGHIGGVLDTRQDLCCFHFQFEFSLSE
jgi:hypothetical protein